MLRIIARSATVGAVIAWLVFGVALIQGAVNTTELNVALRAGTPAEVVARVEATKSLDERGNAALVLALALSGVAWLGRRR